MDYFTIGSIKSFKLEEKKISFTMKGFDSYQIKIDNEEFILFVNREGIKPIKSDTLFTFIDTAQNKSTDPKKDTLDSSLLFIYEAFRNKTLFKFTVELPDNNKLSNSILIISLESYIDD
ncbi:MAG TPA: hypothetical protein PKN54_00880 [Candidatus Cloacimonas acidaminovorans]|jgi:hypothetical protein|nr:hypothetical protein [Candidatus Cloacimonas acidaminovorans]HNZ88173.1 hypothetical protein [Candidatus Cloacimonas acidaminovorans]HOI01272.1 hypothetical protein [Candidatus Cloacimonas acidaminovorans]HPU99388.1 hypothetical protein [Candidatus Cloacimonas acidaminovorans]